MYPPPPDAMLQRLKQSEVWTISFGKYSIHIHIGLEGSNRLSFTAPFRFAKQDSLSESPIFDFPLVESSLMRVLGCSIVEIRCDEDATIELIFSNGDALVVYANNPQYEAYTLSVGESEYVV